MKLYEPRAVSDPVNNPHIEDVEVFILDRNRVSQSNLVIMIGDYPSTGAGQELVIAQQSLVPIVVVIHSARRVSRMLSGMPGIVTIITYDNQLDLQVAIGNEIERLKQRALAAPSVQTATSHVFGSALMRFRNQKNLSRRELAARISFAGCVLERDIELWERSSDQELNPSIAMISAAAHALEISPCQLISDRTEGQS